VYAEEKGLMTTNNPHNEYLNILIQVGLLGLGVFLGFLYTLFKASLMLKSPSQWFAQGLVLAMAVGCLANSWIMDFTSGYFFVMLIAFCFGGLQDGGKHYG
jgi:O-antigen ligase